MLVTTYIHTYHTYIHKHTRDYVHIHTCVCIHTRIHTHTQVRMEALVQTEISAVKHVVVSGGGKEYLACLLTLVCEDNGTSLAGPALSFAQSCGSPATTVDQARRCDAFRDALLKGFANCNKLVCESSKRAGIKGRPAQLRRFTILSQQFSKGDGTLKPTGVVDRKVIIARLGHVIESMYGAVKANAGDVKSTNKLEQLADTYASHVGMHTSIPHAPYGTPMKERPHSHDHHAADHVHDHATSTHARYSEMEEPGTPAKAACTEDVQVHFGSEIKANGHERASPNGENVLAHNTGVVYRTETVDATADRQTQENGHRNAVNATGKNEAGSNNGDIVVSSDPCTAVNGHLDIDADGHVSHSAAHLKPHGDAGVFMAMYVYVYVCNIYRTDDYADACIPMMCVCVCMYLCVCIYMCVPA
jgi:hypothetical protein